MAQKCHFRNIFYDCKFNN